MIGKMNKVVKFEKNVPIAITGTAAKYDDYTEFLTTWGFLKDGRGSRSVSAHEITIDNVTELIVRFQDDLWTELNSDQNKKFKVVIDDRRFTVTAWNKIDEKIAYIRFYLSEKR